MDTKKPRPRALTGKTYNVETPVGKAFITINENGGEQPFEAFINTAKAGSETAAVSEAIGRLISYILRMTSPTKQTDRLREIVRQLLGIGGGRSLGLGPNRVRSLPDGIGQVLDMYLREKAGALPVIEEKTEWEWQWQRRVTRSRKKSKPAMRSRLPTDEDRRPVPRVR